MLPSSDFPNLNSNNWIRTSPRNDQYNCIAWAAGKGPENAEWWWPRPSHLGYTWPDGVPREETIQNFVRAFETLQYIECHDGSCEEGIEKVAIYVKDNVPTHMARQLPDGSWTSKLGGNIDIKHSTLEALEGPKYGSVRVFMQRPRDL